MLKELFKKISRRFTERKSQAPAELIEQVTLPNGTNIAYSPLSGDKLFFTVYINSGSIEDPLGHEGSAHFLEHVLCDYDFEKEMERRGGGIRLGLATSAHGITMKGFIKNTPENAKFLSNQLAQNLTRPISPTTFDLEKKRILNERNIYNDQAAYRHLNLVDAVFKNRMETGHSLGSVSTIRTMTIEDLEDYKNKWLVGPNISIAFSGGDNQKALHSIVANAFKDIPARPTPERSNPQINSGDIRWKTTSPGQLYFAVEFPTKARTLRDHMVESLATEYMDNVVNEELVHKYGIVYDACCRSFSSSVYDGSFGIRGNILPEDADQVAPIVASILAKAEQSIDCNVFEIVKEGQIEGVCLTATAMAKDLADYGRVISYQERTELYESIAPEEVRAFFAETFSNRPAIVTYGDSAKLHSLEEFEEMIFEERVAIKVAPSATSPKETHLSL